MKILRLVQSLSTDVQYVLVDPINLILTNQTLHSLDIHVPVKVIVQISQPVTENPRVKEVVKCGLFYYGSTSKIIVVIPKSIGTLVCTSKV